MISKILIAGLISRLLFSLLPAFAIDFAGWIAWGERLVQLGPANFYSAEVWTNYMPGYLYVLWLVAFVRNFFQIPPNSQLYEVILKFPPNLADLATGVLIFKILKKRVNPRIALISTIFYIFNPVLIFNSAVWGQIDSVFTFFLVLAAYFLAESEKPILASLATSVSFLIKPQTMAILPVFAFYLLQRFGLKNFLKSAAASVFLIFAVSLPFFVKNPILGPPQMFLQMTADYPYTSLFAYNFWWIFGGWKSDTIPILGFSAQIWGLVLLITTQILIVFWLLKNKQEEKFWTAATISLLSFFILPTRVHERYLFPFFSFGAISAAIFGRIFWVIWGVLTLIHLANLYFVYSYYNPNFLKIENLFNLIEKTSTFLSALTVFIFSLMLGALFNRRYQPPTASSRSEGAS